MEKIISFIVEFAREIDPTDFTSFVLECFKDKVTFRDDIVNEEKELL